MHLFKSLYIGWLFLVVGSIARAQSSDAAILAATNLAANFNLDSNSTTKVLVRSIKVKGNRKTKEYIILREVQFKPGDSILTSSIGKAFELARQQVYNTTLFNEVVVDLTMPSAFEIDVVISVKERWYIYPAPQFQLVDRNLNEWWVKNNHDLSRVNYGIKFVHYNSSGRRDPFRLYLINGYTRNISFSYSQPYSNRKLTQGFGIGGGFSQNREMPYKTSYDNQVMFFKQDEFVKKNLYGNVSMRLQKGILSRQTLNLGYSYLEVNDSIISPKYNPAYFNEAVSTKNIVDLSYTWQYANVNNIAYPLKGVTATAVLLKRGLGFTGGINLLSTELNFNKYWAHSRNWFTSIQLFGNIKLPFEQAYINQRALGYGETNLRGLEYYVVDGVAYGLVKATLRKKIFSFAIPFPIKSSTHTSIPFTFFAKTYADAGFSYNKRDYLTNLNNRLLYSGGFGIDILTLYDVHLRFEYSFNQLGESGLFLRSRGGL